MKGGRSPSLAMLCGLALILLGPSARAADDLIAKTVPLRAALHTDPTLDSPLERLVTEYRRAGRVPELLAIYHDHLKQYPQDVNAHVVRLRLLQATNDATFLNAAATSAKAHPKVAYLKFLLFEAMEKRDPAVALEHLDSAIENESRADRRGQWIERLLPLAIRHNRRPLARGRLEQLATAAAGSAEGLLRAAERMQKYGFGEMAITSLAAASALKPAPQIMVKIELTAAETEVQLERLGDASARLDRLLDKLTADYWQRPEIMRRRMALARDKPERQRLIEAARDRMRKSNYAEAAVLNLSELLAGFDQPQAALELLREAASRRPQSVKIEKATLRLFDQLGEERGREQYLAQRIQDYPDRRDLIYERIKTLYLLGRRDQAGRQLDGLVDRLPQAQRIEQLLAVSRFLRQSSLPRDAAALFERVSRAQPDRLDVRREAAEMFLALGQSTRARRLMAQAVPPETSIENLLDAVQFMLNNRMYDPARRALADRLRTDKANLDLRLLAIRIHAKLFESSAGEQMVQESRELADTVARYRRWLEAAAAFHEEFFTTDQFLQAELENLRGGDGDLSTAKMQRHLAFAEVAAQQAESEMALQILRGDLERKPSKKVTLELRRNLVRILEGDPVVQAEVQKQLSLLAQEDPNRSSEYHARLALLHLRSKSGLPQAQALLPRIDIEKIEDPVLLDGLQPLILQQNDNGRILAMLRRATALSPTNEKNWQKYVSALAWAGTEDQLRVALRQLLAGIERMPLEQESIAELQTHLFASYWRQVVQKLAQGKPEALSEALASLQELSRQSLTRNDAACVAWMRAYLSHRLGQEAEREVAVKALRRVLGRSILSAEDEEMGRGLLARDDRLDFPDGLTLSLATAWRLLETPPVSWPAPLAPPPAQRKPLEGNLQLHWAFESTGRSPIVFIHPREERVYAVDATGSVYCLDTANGKIVWQQGQALSPTPLMPQPIRYRSSHGQWSSTTQPGVVPGFLVRGDRIYGAGAGHVRCLSAASGELLWQGELSATPAPGSRSRPPVSMFVYKQKLMAYDAATQTLAAFDAESGKLLWERSYVSGEAMGASWLGSGAVALGERVVLYGPVCLIVRAEDGEIEWVFDPERAPDFPINLETRGDGSDAGDPFGGWAAPTAMGPFHGAHLHRHGLTFSYPVGTAAQKVYFDRSTGLSHTANMGPVSQFLQRPFAFTAAPAIWAASSGVPVRSVHVAGGRLLLANQGMVLETSVELPLLSRRFQVTGVLLAAEPEGYWFLNNTAQVYRTTDALGQIFPIALPQVAAGQAAPRLQAAVDGRHLYLSGPGGIARADLDHLHGPAAGLSLWPKALQAERYQSPRAKSSTAYTQGLMYSDGQAYGPVVPMLGRVVGGRLYTTYHPGQLVVLRGTEAKTGGG